MTNIQTQLINYFRRNKRDFHSPYKDIKAEILSLSDSELLQEYNVHIYELKFYGLIR